jgi:hypothetical protein
VNSDAFERLKERLGGDIRFWPAPYYQEARLFLVSQCQDSAGDDEKLDRLVLEAAIAPTDEQALARRVINRIGPSAPSRFRTAFDCRPWSLPAAAASMLFVLIASAAGGYVTAGANADISDNALLAFTVGVPPSDLAETIGASSSTGGRL